MTTEPAFRLFDLDEEAIATRVGDRLASRIERGEIDEGEIARVREAGVRRFDAPAYVSAAYRACCTKWDVARRLEIRSHRPILGLVLVPVKRALAWMLRFLVEDALGRQAEFNRNVLVVLAEAQERAGAEKGPAIEGEPPA